MTSILVSMATTGRDLNTIALSESNAPAPNPAKNYIRLSDKPNAQTEAIQVDIHVVCELKRFCIFFQ